jgi:hypothetical protein
MYPLLALSESFNDREYRYSLPAQLSASEV